MSDPRHNSTMKIFHTTITGLLILQLLGCSPPGEDSHDGIESLGVPTVGQPAGPRLSTAIDGTVVLSWLEADDSGSTLWYSMLANDGWQPRQAVVSGKDMFVNWADLPAVVPVTDEHWVAHWLEMAGSLTYAYHVLLSQSFDGGQSWSEPIKPHTDNTPTEHGFVSLFPYDGNVAAIWLDGRKTGTEASDDPTKSGMTLRGATIDADGTLHREQLIDELICDCCQTDVAIAASGPVAVYRDRTVNEIRDIFVARFIEENWQQGVPLNNDNWQIAGCPVNGPAIAANGSHVAAAWFSVPDQKPAVQVKLSADSGATFGAAVPIASDGSLGRVDTVILSDNSVVVSWLQSNGAGLASLMVRAISRSGEPGPVSMINSSVPARSAPQMALSGGKLIFVWTESHDSGSLIQSARVPFESLPLADH